MRYTSAPSFGAHTRTGTTAHTSAQENDSSLATQVSEGPRSRKEAPRTLGVLPVALQCAPEGGGVRQAAAPKEEGSRVGRGVGLHKNTRRAMVIAGAQLCFPAQLGQDTKQPRTHLFVLIAGAQALHNECMPWTRHTRMRQVRRTLPSRTCMKEFKASGAPTVNLLMPVKPMRSVAPVVLWVATTRWNPRGNTVRSSLDRVYSPAATPRQAG